MSRRRGGAEAGERRLDSGAARVAAGSRVGLDGGLGCWAMALSHRAEARH